MAPQSLTPGHIEENGRKRSSTSPGNIGLGNDVAVFTLTDAAAYIRVSKAHLSNILNGKVAGVPPLRHARVGRRILIKQTWADDWLEQVGTRATG